MALAVGRDEIIGRGEELDAVEMLLVRATSEFAALVFDGEAGIGKSTLLEAALALAQIRGFRVLVARPARAEAELPFGVFGDLFFAASDDILSQLPEPQRRALEVALLRSDPGGAAVDQRVLSVASLGLLRLLAAEMPLLVAIDDAQWIDESSAGVLAFVLRRLRETPVGAILTVRSGMDERPLELVSSIPEMSLERRRVGALSTAALHRLFVARLGRSFPRLVLTKIGAVSGGNPFYALEIGHALVWRGGHVEPGEPLPIPETLESLMRERIGRLPGRTREALVVAGAGIDPTVEMLTAAGVGDPAKALAPAVREGVVSVEGETVRFAHPLLERAALELASPGARRSVHAALAAQARSAEERALHLGQAAEGPDEEAASALELSATRARTRGASVDASALYLRANELTPDRAGEQATARATLAAECMFVEMSEEAQAVAILERQLERAHPGPARAEALSLRAIVMYSQGEPRAGLPLCEQALAEAGTDPLVRGRVLLRLAWLVADVDLPRALELAAEAVDLFDGLDVSPALLGTALLNHVLCALLLVKPFRDDDVARGTTLLALAEPSLDRQFGMSYVHRLARYTDDLDRAIAISEDDVRDESARGVDGAFNHAMLAELHCLRGDWDAAAEHAHAGLAAYETEWSGDRARGLRAAAYVAACAGRIDEARRFADEALELALRSGDDALEALVRHVRAFTALSVGELSEADEDLTLAAALVERIGTRHPARFKLDGDRVEVSVALGALDRADSVVARFERVALAAPTPWTHAVGARCRGLLEAARGDLDASCVALERAIEAHERLPMPFEHARTLLAKGRVHHRRKEKRLAGETLEEAVRIFEALGSPLWAKHARAELERSGPRQRDPDELNETERQVAELAAQGLSNQEIAQRAFLSVKTVEANLTRVYRKLGIRSRAGLARRLS